MLNKIIPEEWNEALQKTQNNSAPGLLGIMYLVLKNIGAKTKEVCTRLFTKCIEVGSILLKWKIGVLYPIPEKEEWNYELNNIYPIILLENVRKVLSRVLIKRLG